MKVLVTIGKIKLRIINLHNSTYKSLLIMNNCFIKRMSIISGELIKNKKPKQLCFLCILIIYILTLSCNNQPGSNVANKDVVTCMTTPSRFTVGPDTLKSNVTHSQDSSTVGMVYIAGGDFMMGGDNTQALPDEYPKHSVQVNSFWIDITEVTNAQFTDFVNATGYITTAERPVDWQEIKKSLPLGTPKPPDSMLVAASLVFTPSQGPVDLNNYATWWRWQKGADWKHPEGPGSSIKGKDDFMVQGILG